jgi:preprotein translocase subunit SecE
MSDENVSEPTTTETAPSSPLKEELGEEQSLVVREEDDESVLPTQLGATRYVLAAFFAGGMAVAYVVNKAIGAGWNRLADNAWLVQRAPFLSGIAEDDRSTYTTLIGAIIGLLVTIYAYRREDVRTWTNEVAAELAKVSWPSKKEVTNSTVVVIVASAFATIYLALLDRFWGFVTNLVYGA